MTSMIDRERAGIVASNDPRFNPRGYTRWIAANVSSEIPHSMAPITFGLATLSQGNVNGGARMMTAMTVAQVVGAGPCAALGRQISSITYVRLLAAFRTLAFGGLALAMSVEAPLAVMMAAAGLAGLVSGAIYGLLRAILDDVVSAETLPRKLGVAATATELVFVSATVLASVVGGASVVAAIGTMAVASAATIVVLPHVAQRPSLKTPRAHRHSIPLGITVWLLASIGATACVASIEVGAVALAVRQSLGPGAALLFVVPLCVASVLGGIWVSVRNRRSKMATVVVMLLLTSCGALMLTRGAAVWTVVAGAVLLGLFLAPLGTSFSLAMDVILPYERRVEGFALLRSAQAVGVIIASSLMALISLNVAFYVSASLAALSTIAIVASHGGRRRREPT
jgi:MFS family permease